jgi:hypothetical protein
MDMVLYDLGATFFLPRNRQLRRVSHAFQEFTISLRSLPGAKSICSIHEVLIVRKVLPTRGLQTDRSRHLHW